MQPSTIIWRSELPRNPNGKLDRERLKSELMA
jgi:acyl-coenzyme A synthetase/AMP-(fatty) acid ligase